MSSELEERYRRVLDEVSDAAIQAGRRPEDITTIVVTKFHPVSLIRELYALGHRDFGESRHQEAAGKAAELAGEDLVWHFIGQLQSNKARAVAEYAQVIHSVDRISLVEKLRSIDHVIDVFLEVNLTDDPGRGGVLPDDLDALVDAVAVAPTLRLRGLMAVAPLGEEPHRAFRRVLDIRQRFLARSPEATDLSLGMSQDFREAIALGATHLRIGTAITGNRPQPA